MNPACNWSSSFGSRTNRAWGWHCANAFVKFNFELRAATEDAIVLSLSTSHSFELAAVARYLHSTTVRDLLIQAMLDAPMFAARWRWIAGISLALPRFRSGKKVAAPLQRMRADDLMAAVFPDQIACAENSLRAREIPDHPLVNQAVHDCLHEAMDIEGSSGCFVPSNPGPSRSWPAICPCLRPSRWKS
jgi:ATP-dependent Lhr-like helicase